MQAPLVGTAALSPFLLFWLNLSQPRECHPNDSSGQSRAMAKVLASLPSILHHTYSFPSTLYTAAFSLHGHPELLQSLSSPCGVDFAAPVVRTRTGVLLLGNPVSTASLGSQGPCLLSRRSDYAWRGPGTTLVLFQGKSPSDLPLPLHHAGVCLPRHPLQAEPLSTMTGSACAGKEHRSIEI